ncbi:MAG: DUF5667 domain-containing protein [bacterium]|nr:DUF5667 domain-containing protein [bacterium]
MKNILIAGIVLMAMPFVSFAQTGATGTVAATGTITVTNPGLLPGDFFYFLDKLTEAFNTALTFNKEKKARLHLEYAKERIVEIKEVLKDTKAKIEDVTSAKSDFDTEISAAATLVKEEKDKGSDVKELAKELDDELDDMQDELKDIFKDHKDEYSRAEIALRAKIAALAPGDPQIKGLTQALLSITKEKEAADKEEEDVDDDLMDEQDLFDEIMGDEASAMKHQEDVMHMRAEMNAAGASANISASSRKLLLDAEVAAKRGDYEAAKRMFKQAENTMEHSDENSANASLDVDISSDILDMEIRASEKVMMEDSWHVNN